MKTKILEVRDEGTMISMLCVDMNPDTAEERYYLRRHGYACDGSPNILITHVSADGGPATNDPCFWKDRTRSTARMHIIAHWDDLLDGDVVDVQFIRGETAAPKKSERLTTGVES